MDDLIRLTARQAVSLLRAGQVSPLELIEAATARIRATDEAVNALPTRCAERARDAAAALAGGSGERDHPGWLAGLPIAVKDLLDVEGVRTTYGSTVFADHVPAESDLVVETLERRGALVLAKSNTPEFGAGANTFNDVFGTTRNPWDTTRTCGGSSGGSAVALATGQAWLATGSDLGGSLRIPAAFCGVVGLRPSPGRVARYPRLQPFDTLSVEGPMGRTVGDVALMLDAMSGQHPRDPLALPPPATPFQAAVERPAPPRRVAFSPDLGGAVAVDPEIAEVCRRAAARFDELGVAVEEASPSFAGADETFHTLRAAFLAADLAPLMDKVPDRLKPDLIWNVERGLGLSASEVGRAQRARGRLYYRMVEFFERYDLLLCPAAPVAPFDAGERYVSEIAGRRFDNYVDWFAVTFAISLTACPALSLPCGTTAGGLPVGLQMVGPPRGEAALLAAAALAEEMFGLAGRLPIDPQGRPGPREPHETPG
jgi:amidase